MSDRTNPPPFLATPYEVELLGTFRRLSPAGRDVAMGQIRALATVPRRWPDGVPSNVLQFPRVE